MVIASRFTQLYQILREKQANNINVMTWAMTSYTGLGKKTNNSEVLTGANLSILKSILLLLLLFLHFACLARIITVLLSSVDKMLLLNFVTSFAGSASILASAIYYQKRSKKDN